MITDPRSPAVPTGARPDALPRLGLSLLLLLVLCALCMRFGLRPITWHAIYASLTQYNPLNADHIVLYSVRLPRLIAAVLAGGCLGMAGALMQALTRNPLADPGLLGVNAGAAMGVVICAMLLRISDPGQFIWAALGGACLAAVLVFFLGGRAPSRSGRLILAGAAISALFFAIIRGVLIVSQSSLDVYRFWVLGGFDGMTLAKITALLPFMTLGALLAFIASFGLNALLLGEDTAKGLGQRVGLLQLLTGAAIVLLCAATVAMAGPLAFIGLIVPHIARSISPSDMRWIALFSAIFGSSLMCLADLLGRLQIFGGTMQAGVMSAMIGGPVLIWLVRSGGARKI